MKVLITIPDLHGKGGVSNYYRAIIPFFYARKELDVSCIEIGSAKRSCRFIHPFIDQINFFKKVTSQHIDLVHVNPSLDPKSLLRDATFIYLAKKRKIPVIVFFRGWHVRFESLFKNPFFSFFRYCFLKADAFIVLSSAFKEKLRSWGVNAPIYTETTTIDDELLTDFSIEQKQTLWEKSYEVKILFLARVEKEKGIFETLEAFKILLKRNYDVFLTIAGDGSAMSRVKESILRFELDDNKVVTLGYVRGPKKKEVFSTHHIYCFPSYGEGMPNSVLEAMAFGMPVVTRPVGGIKDFFQNGKMGFITDKKDPEIIADLIEKMILDKNRMIDMALFNHLYAKEHFLASRVAMRLIQIYKKTYSETQNQKHK